MVERYKKAMIAEINRRIKEISILLETVEMRNGAPLSEDGLERFQETFQQAVSYIEHDGEYPKQYENY